MYCVLINVYCITYTIHIYLRLSHKVTRFSCMSLLHYSVFLVPFVSTAMQMVMLISWDPQLPNQTNPFSYSAKTIIRGRNVVLKWCTSVHQVKLKYDYGYICAAYVIFKSSWYRIECTVKSYIWNYWGMWR